LHRRTCTQAWANGQSGAQVAQFFNNINPLEGVPVINVHLWFDRKLTSVRARL
jgi:uncharacterized protein with NAD-binding domain and iron-sulfur cluster